MAHFLRYITLKGTSLLSVAVIVLCATTAVAQGATNKCGPSPVIPLTGTEPPGLSMLKERVNAIALASAEDFRRDFGALPRTRGPA